MVFRPTNTGGSPLWSLAAARASRRAGERSGAGRLAAELLRRVGTDSITIGKRVYKADELKKELAAAAPPDGWLLPGGDAARSGRADGGMPYLDPDWTTPMNRLRTEGKKKVGLAVAPSDPRRVYAMIEADKGGLFRSDDAGESWSLINSTRIIRQRAWYYSTLTVDPKKPDVVWIPQVPLLRSIDGGKTFHKVKGVHHSDHHDIWIDPKNPLRIIDSNDGGVDISLNGGETWFAPPLPIAQFYHITCDTSVPYRVMGNMQDLGTASGPSNSLSGSINLSDWHGVGGGETGFSIPDPNDPNIVYAGEYGGYITRFDARTRQARNIGIYPFNPSGHDPANLKYRFQWTAPIAVSPHAPKTVYHPGDAE